MMQLLLGVLLEIVHKWKRIAIIYFASALGGSLFTTVLDNGNFTVGASDGVYGLMFAHIATIILNWSEMERKFSKLFCVLLYVMHDIGTTLYTELVEKQNSSVRSNLIARSEFIDDIWSIFTHSIDKSCSSFRRRYNRIFGVNFGVEKFS